MSHTPLYKRISHDTFTSQHTNIKQEPKMAAQAKTFYALLLASLQLLITSHVSLAAGGKWTLLLSNVGISAMHMQLHHVFAGETMGRREIEGQGAVQQLAVMGEGDQRRQPRGGGDDNAQKPQRRRCPRPGNAQHRNAASTGRGRGSVDRIGVRMAHGPRI